MRHCGKVACPVTASYASAQATGSVTSCCDVWVSSFLYLLCLYLTKKDFAAAAKVSTYFVVLQGSLQEVIGWGLIGWKHYANVIGPVQCEGLASLGVTQIACAEKRFLILSRTGRVYTQTYNSDTLVGVMAGVGVLTGALLYSWYPGLSSGHLVSEDF